MCLCSPEIYAPNFCSIKKQNGKLEASLQYPLRLFLWIASIDIQKTTVPNLRFWFQQTNGLSETPLHVLLLQRDKANEKCCFFTSFWKTSQTKPSQICSFKLNQTDGLVEAPYRNCSIFEDQNFDFVDCFFETLETVFDTFLTTDSFLKLFDISQKEPKKIEMVDATERTGCGKLTAQAFYL